MNNLDQSAFLDTYAIVGQSVSLPGASNINIFWENLISGKISIDEVTKDRWDWKEKYGIPSETNQNTLCKWASLLPDFRYFDNDFFRISKKEGKFLDPQIRILLQLAWNCFEDAGYNPDSYRGKKVGVFMGVCHGDFKIVQQWYKAYTVHGTPSSMIANRISHFFNLLGPSLVVDTACSSSLVALHVALQALKSGDCDSFLLGAVNYMPYDLRITALGDLGVLSSTGHCKSFDNGADGIIIGEGAGVILIKKTEDAIRDNDHIYGIIRGSNINHGGNARTVTSPSLFAQSSLITDVYKKHKVSPDSVVYIEAHGTGTNLGDPLEVNALKRAFWNLEKDFDLRLKENTIPIGSVKPNVGHSEAAAGLTGILKILKIFETNTVPPMGDFKNLNERIKFENSPFYIAKNQEKLREVEKGPRRVGISSFGIGGTNVHVILEEPPKQRKNKNKKNRKKFVLPLSAKKAVPLRQMAFQLASFIEEKLDNVSLDVIENALQTGRKTFQHRLAIIAKNREDAVEQLQDFANNKEIGNGSSYVESPSIDGEPKLPKKISLAVLTKRWLEGYEVDWNLAYSERPNVKTPVPGYVFMKNDLGLGNEDYLKNKKKKKELSSDEVQNAERSATTGRIKLKSLSKQLDEKEENTISQAVVQEESSTDTDLNTIKSTGLEDVINLCQVKSLLAEVLLTIPEKISEELTFQEIGLDSITGIEFINKLNKSIDEKLKATVLYDVTTPIELLSLLNGRRSKHTVKVTVETDSNEIHRISDFSKNNNVDVKKENFPSGEHRNALTDESILKEIVNILGNVLSHQIQNSEHGSDFHELGLDSITGVDLINKINKKFSIKLDSTSLYDYTNLRSFSHYVSSLLRHSTDQQKQLSFSSPEASEETIKPNDFIDSEEDIDSLLDKFERDELPFEEVVKKLMKD